MRIKFLQEEKPGSVGYKKYEIPSHVTVFILEMCQRQVKSINDIYSVEGLSEFLKSYEFTIPFSNDLNYAHIEKIFSLENHYNEFEELIEFLSKYEREIKYDMCEKIIKKANGKINTKKHLSLTEAFDIIVRKDFKDKFEAQYIIKLGDDSYISLDKETLILTRFDLSGDDVKEIIECGDRIENIVNNDKFADMPDYYNPLAWVLESHDNKTLKVADKKLIDKRIVLFRDELTKSLNISEFYFMIQSGFIDKNYDVTELCQNIYEIFNGIEDKMEIEFTEGHTNDAKVFLDHIKTEVNKKKASKNEASDNDLYKGLLILTAFVLSFVLVNNWKIISPVIAPALSWITNICFPALVAFFSTNIGIGVAVAIGVLALAGIVTAVVLRNGNNETIKLPKDGSEKPTKSASLNENNSLSNDDVTGLDNDIRNEEGVSPQTHTI